MNAPVRPIAPAHDDLLNALECLLKTEPAVAIRRAAQRLYIELTEPRKEIA